MAETKKISNELLIAIIVVVVILVVLVFFVGRSIGKNRPPTPKTLPDDNNPGTVGAPLSVAEQTAINGLSARIYNDVKGLTFTGHDNDLYQEALNLSDRLTTALYNTYNNQYYNEFSQTLTQVLSGEIEPFGQRKIFTFRDRLVNLNLN